MSTTKYVKITADKIPDGVRFDVPQRNGGQIIEVAYGGFGRAEHDEGDKFMRIHDRSDMSTTLIRYESTSTDRRLV